MPQGKLKVKTKLPKSIKKKAKPKGPSTVRKNKPIAPKKGKFEEAEKLKKLVTKNVNKNLETEVRSLATGQSKVATSKKKEKALTAEANKMPPKKKQTS